MPRVAHGPGAPARRARRRTIPRLCGQEAGAGSKAPVEGAPGDRNRLECAPRGAQFRDCAVKGEHCEESKIEVTGIVP